MSNDPQPYRANLDSHEADFQPHTPEPWDVYVEGQDENGNDGVLRIGAFADNRRTVISTLGRDSIRNRINANRIVNCVNACAGIEDSSLIREMMAVLCAVRDAGDAYYTEDFLKAQEAVRALVAKFPACDGK
jgi:hypothetical protein